MKLCSVEIRKIIKSTLKEGLFSSTKWNKTDALLDKSYYTADDVEQMNDDIESAQFEIERLFGINKGYISNLYTQEDIFDCDNFAFALKSMLSIQHYRRFLDGSHGNRGEYFCLVAIIKKPGLLGGHFVHACNLLLVNEKLWLYDMTDQSLDVLDHENKSMLLALR